MRVLIFMAVSLIGSLSLTTSSEKEIFFNSFMEPTSKKNAAYYGEIVETTEQGVHIKAFFMSSELKMEGWYENADLMTENGIFTYYFQSGQVESQGLFKEGYKCGVWKRYERNGKEKPEKVYESLQTMKAIEEAKKAENKNK